LSDPFVSGHCRFREISFNQINKNTGHRIKYTRIDAETGEQVPNEDIVRGFKVDTDTYVEVTKEELENVALESTRTIDIDEFVQREEIDPRYIIRPGYLRPDGKVGHDAFAVIRETIRDMNMVASGRVVLTSLEHIIALEPLDKGLMGRLLRNPDEVRDKKQYFDEIQDVKTRDMLDLAKHVVNQKAGQFEPEKFEDQYEAALVDLINKKRAGQPIAKRDRPVAGNVVDLMEAQRRSVGAGEDGEEVLQSLERTAGDADAHRGQEGGQGSDHKEDGVEAAAQVGLARRRIRTNLHPTGASFDLLADRDQDALTAALAFSGETPCGGSSRAMSTARSLAFGSARSLIQPCFSHSWMAPTSSGTEIAHPSIVRNAARLSFTTSIAIFHSGTGRILEVANSSRVSILGSEVMIGICPRSKF
jgi:DNA end-binding protein Ku